MEFYTWSTQRQEAVESCQDRDMDISDESAKSVLDRQKLRRK